MRNLVRNTSSTRNTCSTSTTGTTGTTSDTRHTPTTSNRKQKTGAGIRSSTRAQRAGGERTQTASANTSGAQKQTLALRARADRGCRFRLSAAFTLNGAQLIRPAQHPVLQTKSEHTNCARTPQTVLSKVLTRTWHASTFTPYHR